MFSHHKSASKPSTKSRASLKRGRHDDVSEQTEADALIASLFSRLTAEQRDYWQYNIVMATEVASIVYASAARLRIRDPEFTEYLIKSFIFPWQEDPFQQMESARDEPSLPHQHRYTTKEMTVKNQCTRDLTCVLDVFKHCDVDALLSLYFEERHGPLGDPLQSTMVINMNGTFRELYDENFKPASFRDFLAIEKFLSREEKVTPYFDQLEKDLQKYASSLPRDQHKLVRVEHRWKLPIFNNNLEPNACYKILSGYLYQWAKENGFQQSAKLIDALSPEVFHGLLTKLTFFKDCANNIGKTHGVWSHALQWYLIIEHHKKTGFLSCPPLSLYAEFGNIWDEILDLVDDRRFTSPEHVTRTMSALNLRERWPLLAESFCRASSRTTPKDGSNYQYSLRLKHYSEAVDGVVIRKFK